MILSVCKDKSFDDEELVDGNRLLLVVLVFKVFVFKIFGNFVNSVRKFGLVGGFKVGGVFKEGGVGVVDEDDFIKVFIDVFFV